MTAITKKVAWWFFALLAIGVGCYPALYFFAPGDFGVLQSKPAHLLADPVWYAAFYTHILLGGVALLIGWIQFDRGLQKRRPKLHKRIGMGYVTAVFFSSLAGIYIGFFATGGLVSASGFVSLGVVWLGTTMVGWYTAKKHRYDVHEDWMTFSYAATFAAVTLRIWLPILIVLHQG